ncbi:AAA family ATPase [Streptococcus mutans]|uniref:AAA family ATPase n=1 Tax=Streptococcus mutans TaxID=1309 RepID=UPI0004654FC5|nr:AAA family ATPase [Streptococcus mutans]MCB4950996.1 ATP-binding protein [Streptococcus mutans]MCB5006861.1 ATP-binding protein [Streptococcus mutans]MCB5029280.1 ATP-binding protein [Streptococcus mutans]MCB5037243.1 ATP-binding protein [Streptococcus mutans]NLQ36835.1 ABC transporter ATP-binding protein [Streptococcus mutans]
MYIESFKVIKLHKIYNYDVKFNKDITILYGENGSGKTTLLSILESILTARIWELFQFDFKKIILKSDVNFSIDILRGVDKENGLYLEIKILKDNNEEKSERIFQTAITSLNSSRYGSKVDLDDVGLLYPIISEINRSFNDLYLPINRIPFSFLDEGRTRRKVYQKTDMDIDSSLDYAIELLTKENRIIESRKNRYNQEFKNEILLNSLSVSRDNLVDILQNEEVLDLDKIDSLQEKYLKMLDDLNIPSDQNKVELFLSNYKAKIPKITNYLNKETEQDNGEQVVDIMTFFFEASEIMRMKKVLPIAENLERRLSDISAKIDKFIKIVNDFFEDSMEKKEIIFDTLGVPYFKIKGRKEKIKLKYLSSGEKQIVILFANLILTNRYSGGNKIFRNIFIADEPEISLHMLWQMKLIPSILKSRKNLQIILATHSPEIVGEFENKMFELKKERVDNERWIETFTSSTS